VPYTLCWISFKNQHLYCHSLQFQRLIICTMGQYSHTMLSTIPQTIFTFHLSCALKNCKSIIQSCDIIKFYVFKCSVSLAGVILFLFNFFFSNKLLWVMTWRQYVFWRSIIPTRLQSVMSPKDHNTCNCNLHGNSVATECDEHKLLLFFIW
jgi:hypothetical protein